MIKDVFIDFLNKHNIKEKFINNLMIERNVELDVFIEIARPEDYIDNAFHWAQTPEGYEFWGKIHEKWIDNF